MMTVNDPLNHVKVISSLSELTPVSFTAACIDETSEGAAKAVVDIEHDQRHSVIVSCWTFLIDLFF